MTKTDPTCMKNYIDKFISDINKEHNDESKWKRNETYFDQIEIIETEGE